MVHQYTGSFFLKEFDEKIIVTKTPEKIKAKCKDHFHYYYEIYYFLGDRMSWNIEGKGYTVSRNDVLLVKPVAAHSAAYNESCSRERILILFHPSIIELSSYSGIKNSICEIFNRGKLSIQEAQAALAIEESFQHLHRISMQQKTELYPVKLEYALLSLLVQLYECSVAGRTIEKTDESWSAKEQLVHKAIAFIKENFRNNISLTDVAGGIYSSKYYLSHIFKEITGKSVVDYINNERLSYSERQLTYSDINITTVAMDCGFMNTSYFMRKFKGKNGCTPSEFREKMNSGISHTA